MAFASPGVSIKEIDLTPIVNVSDQNVGAVVIAAETGPVDTVTFISSERELVDTFGRPNDYNYESWFAASTIIEYGGIAAVIRPSGSNITLNSSSDTGLSNFTIKSKFDFDNYNGTAFKFAGRTAGEKLNSLRVVAVDHGADQIINYAATTGKITTFTTTGTATGGAASYPNVAYTTNGSGTGAILNVEVSAGNVYTVTITGGENFVVNDTITILGSDVGGAAPANNITLTVTGVVVDPTVTPGDAIVIKNGATKVGTGWVYKVDTTTNKFYIVLNKSTERVPSSAFNNYSITDNADTPTTLIAAGDIISVDNTYYDSLEYASGLKWREVAPQPGTSSSVASKGGKFDEMHILVLDEDGVITGVPNTILEKYLFVSKAKDASTLDGSLVYFHSAIAEKSKYIFPGFGAGLDFIGNSKINLEGPANSTASIGETNSANKLYSLISSINYSPTLGFSLSGGKDYEFTTDLADIESATTNAYELLRDSEGFNDIDFLIPGKISVERASKLIDIASSRKDCMAVISPRRSDVINSSASSIKTEAIIDFFSGLASSSFAIFDSGYKYIYDKFNDTYRYVPCAADVAGLCISTTINSETWFSPAGYNRGNLKNATKLAYSPKQSERDRLYTNRINPIVSFPGQGIVLFGDKTALSSPSAFSRINVRRLFIELEKNVATFSKFQLFEINDEITRSSFKAAVEPYLRGVQGRRGIYDFLVICDETNNSADVIDRNEFNAEIYIKPARSINYITITFIATRTGVSFSELTQ